MIDPNCTMTDIEHSTLETARHLLGDNLSDFLLSGLGETQITYRRAFSAQSISPHVDARTYHFEMVSESQQGLPIERDPLVLAALLDILCERQPLDSTILFHENELLQKLQWSQDVESRRLIKRALERYALTAYCLTNSTVNEEDPGGHHLSVGRLLIGYQTSATLLSRKALEQPPLMRVQFLPAIIHDVISERKSFLEIEFQRLTKLRHLFSVRSKPNQTGIEEAEASTPSSKIEANKP